MGKGSSLTDMPDLLYHSPQFYKLPAENFSIQDTLSGSYSVMDGNSKSKIAGASNDFFVMKGNMINAFLMSGSYSESGTATLPVQTTAKNYTVNDQLEWYFTPSWYSFAGAHWDSNEIAGFKADYGARAGVGMFLTESAEFIARIELGYDHSTIDRVAPFPNETLGLGMGGLRVVWIGERIFLNLSYKYFQDFKESAHQRHKVSAQLFIGITSNLFYVVGYDMLSDNRVPKGFEEVNSLTSNSLMMKF